MSIPSTPHVLMVTASYYPFMGGLETHVYEVSRRMKDYNIDVSILTTDRTGNLPENDVVEGVPVRRVPAYPKNRDYYYAPDLVTEIKRSNCDLIHCQGGMTLVPAIAMYAAKRTGLPYVLSFHSNAPASAIRRNFIRPIQYRILRHFMKDAEQLIAVSKYESDFFQKHLNLSSEKFTIISNGAGLPVLDNLPESDSESPLIVSVGRLHHLKGHHRLIQAMPEIIENVPTARLRIAGSGEYENDLRGLITSLNLDSYITIEAIPPGEREEMTRLLASASLVVLLSQYEAHPLAVLEALSLGRPMVVTYTSGMMEFADEGLVQSVKLDSDTKAIAQKVIQQLKNPVFPPEIPLPTWDECAKNTAQLYRQSLA